MLLPISRSKPAAFWSWVQSSTTAPPAIIVTDEKALTGPLHWWNTIFSNSFCKHCSSVCGVKTCFELLHSFVTQSGLDHQVTVYINDVPTSCASGVDCSFTWSGADTPTITAITPTTGNLLTFWAQSASSLLQDSYIQLSYRLLIKLMVCWCTDIYHRHWNLHKSETESLLAF